MTARDQWERSLRHDREQKDEFFAESPRSPLPASIRADFSGLKYFDPNPELRFDVELAIHDEKQMITVETTTDGTQEYVRWGEFAIQVDEERVSVQAYKGDPDEDRLWVPFRDVTNGAETYGGGRYLDLESPADRVNGAWRLDFNRAYNPYCVYNDDYECPLVPLENWLDIPIEAGEQLPSFASKGTTTNNS